MPYKHQVIPLQAHEGNETAEQALHSIVDGFKRFRNEVFPQQEELFKKLATAQNPRAMFITCADSRVVPELITQSSPGDLFVNRNVGNVVPAYGQMMGGVSTAIEYAVMALGVQHIVICGHSDCGAMKAVLNPASLETMPTVKAWLRHAEVARSVVAENCNCSDDKEALAVLTEENVVAQLNHLCTHPSVAAKLARGQLFIHGWVYDIETSQIKAYDAELGSFLPLDGDKIPMATPRARFVGGALAAMLLPEFHGPGGACTLELLPTQYFHLRQVADHGEVIVVAHLQMFGDALGQFAVADDFQADIALGVPAGAAHAALSTATRVGNGPAGCAERFQIGQQALLQRRLADHGEQGAAMCVHLRTPRRSVVRPAPGTAECRSGY